MSLTAGQLFLSSYNNQDGQTSTDFSLTLSVPVTKAKRLRLLGATIPNLFMPFANNDKAWTFKVNGTDYTMTFPTNSRWETIADFITFSGQFSILDGNSFNGEVFIIKSNSSSSLTIHLLLSVFFEIRFTLKS